MDPTRSIDLLPQISEEEVEEVEEKGKINLYGVFFVFLVVSVSLIVLGGSLLAQLDYNKQSQNLADAEGEILDLQYLEIKQRTLNNKISTYTSVEDRDFYADVVLQYLMEVTESLSTVRSLYLDDNLTFEVRGYTSSYTNVARLWHDMSRREDFFEIVSLQYARKSEENEGIVFCFKGVIKRESLDKL